MASAVSAASLRFPIFVVELVSEDLRWIVMAFAIKELRRLRVGSDQLFVRRVQAIAQVIPTPAFDRRVDQLSSHCRHLPVGFFAPRLVERHDESEHLAIGIAQENSPYLLGRYGS